MTNYILLARLEKEIQQIVLRYDEVQAATQGHKDFPTTLREMEYDDLNRYSSYAKRAYATALRAVEQMISLEEKV